MRLPDQRPMTPEQRILRDLRAGKQTIVVDSPPTSWAVLKPHVLPFLKRNGRRSRRLQLVGYPLCAVGESWRALAAVTGPPRVHHPACRACVLRDECSPPVRWNGAELQPFGSRDPVELFQRFHGRFRRATGAGPNPMADEMVTAHAETLRSLPGGVWELEPSVVVSDRLEPRLRLVVFHGPQPKDPIQARAVTHQLIESWAQMHEIAGASLPDVLRSVLERHSPFEMPLGFEMRAADQAQLKAYARVHLLSPQRRRAFVTELLEMIEQPSNRAGLGELERDRPTLFDDLQMVGFATQEGTLVALKLYVQRHGRQGWPEIGIAPPPADHPFEVLSKQRALTVVDLAHPEERAHKLDFFLRERLLSGPMLAELGRRAFVPSVADQLSTLVEHEEFRVDVVAGSLRGESWAFYLALG
ncbi:MAG: hypothetical protein AB8I08_40370 [Sandaracinaceae bacterium]